METDGIIMGLKRAAMLIFIFLLQTVFADKMRIMGISPNFVFCYLLVVSFKNYPHYGFYAALILGIFADAVSGRVFGAYTFLFVLTEEIIKNYYTKLFTENFLFECLGGFVFNFLFSFLFAIAEWLFIGNFAHIFLKIALPEFIYNQIIFIIFLFISKKIKKKRRSIFRI